MDLYDEVAASCKRYERFQLWNRPSWIK